MCEMNEIPVVNVCFCILWELNSPPDVAFASSVVNQGSMFNV